MDMTNRFMRSPYEAPEAEVLEMEERWEILGDPSGNLDSAPVDEYDLEDNNDD